MIEIHQTAIVDSKTELGKTDLENIMADSVMSGPGVYLEKPVRPAAYVHHIKEALGIEVSEADTDKINLKEQLESQMRNASPEAIQRALDALRNK